MTKIVFYCSSLSWGGLEMNLIREANWLSKRGNQIVIMCGLATPIQQSAAQHKLPYISVSRNRKYYDLRNGKRIAKRLRKEQTNVLWIADNRDLSLAATVKTILGKSIKVLYRQTMQLGVKKRSLFHTIRYSNIDTWVCPLNWLAAEVQAKTKMKANRIEVIPLGVEADQFTKNRLSKDAARTQLKLPLDQVLLGVIGRFDPQKGQHFLIEALPLLRKEFPNIGLVMMGEPTKNETSGYAQNLHSKIIEMGLEESVFIRPFMQEVNVFYSAIDLFCMPSKGETFGMVTIEAMLSGLPVIGTNTGGTPELLENGNLGILFEPDNLTEFVTKIGGLLQNSTYADELGKEARKVAETQYSHEIISEQLEGLLV